MQKVYSLILCCVLASNLSQSQNAGTLDNSFNGNGKFSLDFGFQDNINDVTLQADQKIICTGVELTPSFAAILKVIRLNADGTLDSTFATNGVYSQLIGVESYGNESFVRTDGKIIVAGITYDANYLADWLLLRLNSNGTLDSTFGTNGITVADFSSSDDLGQALALQTDNKIIVSGTIKDTVSYFNLPAIARFTEDGIIDSSFGTNGFTTFAATYIDNEVTSVAVQSNGKIVAAGHYENTFTGSSDFDVMVLRIDSTGIPDATFGINGIVRTPVNGGVDDSFGMEPDTAGNIYVAGFTTQPFTLELDMILLKYDSNGTLVPGFGNNGIVTFDSTDADLATDLKIQTDGKIVVGGSSGIFPFGPRDFALWRYEANGNLDSSFGYNGFVTTAVLPNFQDCNALVLQNDGKIVAAGRVNNGNDNDAAVVRYLNDINTSYNEINIDEDVNLFPNPATKGQTIYLHFENNCGAVVKAELLDLNGRNILNDSTIFFLSQNKVSIHLPQHITSGIYFIKLSMQNKTSYKKVTVID